MSYKFGTERFQTKLIESAKDGKRAILLYKNNSAPKFTKQILRTKKTRTIYNKCYK